MFYFLLFIFQPASSHLFELPVLLIYITSIFTRFRSFGCVVWCLNKVAVTYIHSSLVWINKERDSTLKQYYSQHFQLSLRYKVNQLSFFSFTVPSTIFCPNTFFFALFPSHLHSFFSLLFFFICCCSCCYCLPHDNVSFVCLELLKFILEIKILTPFSAISVPLLSKMNFEWRDIDDDNDERKIPDKEYMNLTSMDSTLYEINLSNTLKSTFEPNVCQEIVLTRTDMNQKS